MNTINDYYRTRALEALGTYGQHHAEPAPPSHTYWVYQAWRYGERDIAQLAKLARISRQTIYSDLATYDVEVPEDLERRLARWIEDTAQAGLVSFPNSDYMGIADRCAGPVAAGCRRRRWWCPGVYRPLVVCSDG